MRVLIIDDEPNVRAGVKVIIPWKDYDFEIIGEGIDGIDGLNKIMTLMPELVLIDIRMPGLSGLEVVEKARESGYRGKFIITTGYSDFEYAKRAIHLDVSHYILKPIDEEELMEAVLRIKEQILDEEEKRARLEVSDQYIEQSIMRQLILGKALNTYEQKYYEQLVNRQEEYYIVIIDIEDKGKHIEKILQTCKEEVLEQMRCIVLLSLNHLV